MSFHRDTEGGEKDGGRQKSVRKEREVANKQAQAECNETQPEGAKEQRNENILEETEKQQNTDKIQSSIPPTTFKCAPSQSSTVYFPIKEGGKKTPNGCKQLNMCTSPERDPP